MKRYKLDADDVPEELREHFALLRAADPGTKMAIGWRMRNAVWIYDGGETDKRPPLVFYAELDDIINTIKPKE